MWIEKRENLLKSLCLYFLGALGSCLYAKQVTLGLNIIDFFFFFLEEGVYISIPLDRSITTAVDSLGLQNIFHHQRGKHVNTSRCGTVFLLFRQKSSTDYVNLATLLGNTTV